MKKLIVLFLMAGLLNGCEPLDVDYYTGKVDEAIRKVNGIKKESKKGPIVAHYTVVDSAEKVVEVDEPKRSRSREVEVEETEELDLESNVCGVAHRGLHGEALIEERQKVLRTLYRILDEEGFVNSDSLELQEGVYTGIGFEMKVNRISKRTVEFLFNSEFDANHAQSLKNGGRHAWTLLTYPIVSGYHVPVSKPEGWQKIFIGEDRELASGGVSVYTLYGEGIQRCTTAGYVSRIVNFLQQVNGFWRGFEINGTTIHNLRLDETDVPIKDREQWPRPLKL